MDQLLQKSHLHIDFTMGFIYDIYEDTEQKYVGALRQALQN